MATPQPEGRLLLEAAVVALPVATQAAAAISKGRLDEAFVACHTPLVRRIGALPGHVGLAERRSISVPCTRHSADRFSFLGTAASLCRVDRAQSMPASKMALTWPSWPV